jgi:hypothetical protein
MIILSAYIFLLREIIIDYSTSFQELALKNGESCNIVFCINNSVPIELTWLIRLLIIPFIPFKWVIDIINFNGDFYSNEVYQCNYRAIHNISYIQLEKNKITFYK